MRAIRVFGSFVYMTAVIFFCLCISAGPLCISTINNVIVGRTVSSRVLDEVYRVWPEVTYEQMEAIEKGITESDALQRLTGDLLDAMAEEAAMEEIAENAEMTEPAGWWSGNEADIFLADKTVEELKEGVYSEVIKGMGELPTGEQKTVLEDGIEIQVNIIASGLKTVAAGILGDVYLPVNGPLRLYASLTSLQAKAASFLFLFAGAAAILWAGRQGAGGLRLLGWDSMAAGLLTGAAIPFAISASARFLTNRILGRTVGITLTPLLFCGGIVFAVGLLLLALAYVLQKRRSGRL
ncbi:hypothetical protein [Eisenbergiella sp.]